MANAGKIASYKETDNVHSTSLLAGLFSFVFAGLTSMGKETSEVGLFWMSIPNLEEHTVWTVTSQQYEWSLLFSSKPIMEIGNCQLWTKHRNVDTNGALYWYLCRPRRTSLLTSHLAWLIRTRHFIMWEILKGLKDKENSPWWTRWVQRNLTGHERMPASLLTERKSLKIKR